MKKGLAIILLSMAIFIGFGQLTRYYTREGVVTEINGEEITVEDASGNEWVFCGNGFHIGDNVKMKMDSKGTDFDIYDDEIKKVEKN